MSYFDRDNLKSLPFLRLRETIGMIFEEDILSSQKI
jgi:hypothetical protein